MSSITETPVVVEEPTDEGSLAERAGALMGRIFEAGLGWMEILTVYIGERLGLYTELWRGGPATAGELAGRAGIDGRYAREWLEQQAAAGFLDVDDAATAADERRYALPPAHAAVLADRDSQFYVGYLPRFVPGMSAQAPAVVEAFRTGGGIPWSAYGQDVIEAQGGYNRTWLVGALGSTYLPAIPDVDARLRATPPAMVLDVACGVGWASIAIATAYPDVQVTGIDSDAASIALARRNAEESGVADRVRFELVDAAEPIEGGPFDLAIVIEAIHDMSHPVEALASIRRSLAPGGILVVTDEKVGDAFVAPAEFGERFCYASSVTICLPGAMADQPSEAVGAVIRPSTMRDLGSRAGYSAVQVLDELEHDAQYFYRLDP